MSEAATSNGGMASIAIAAHGQNARVTARGTTTRETIGCELAEEVIRSFGEVRLRVSGSSMVPSVWPGDILTVRSHDATEPLPGDIVVYRRDGRLVTHRVVEVRKPESEVRISNPESLTPALPGVEFVTRGDRVRQNDAPISKDEILGRVVSLKRGLQDRVPHRTPANRLASWILRYSDFATRVVVKCRI